MFANDNRALLYRYVEEVWDKESPAGVEMFLAPNYKRHQSPITEPLTRDGQKELLSKFRTAFPDIRLTIEEIIATEDKIAFRSTMRATHKGEFLGIPPTGKQIEIGLVDLVHVENGKFVEQWGGPDLLDLVQQLGVEVSLKQLGQ
jgi:steroid delta-isomerase-like uncharacterized protein